MAAHEKTEKATPKRREEARKKGQVARSADLSSAAVLLASIFALAAFLPAIFERLGTAMRSGLALAATPAAADRAQLGSVLADAGRTIAFAAGPLLATCALAGLVVNAAQVRLRLTPEALKPDFRRINPATGAKNVFGRRMLFEGGKTLAKVGVIGGVVAAAVLPGLPELAALVGIEPAQFAARLGSMLFGVAERAGIAYLVIGAVDFAWQRRRHEKDLRMDKQEVKEEHRQQNLAPEVRSAMRRRQMQAARARMMAAVPTADVVVANPTHYAVALRFDGTRPAPEVVAKGKDLIAQRIREVAREHGVTVVSDPPLARALHAGVEIGQLIPESFYQAVAELLAFVYRTARRRAA
jgi:flagellar biosynthetic protein FlhB